MLLGVINSLVSKSLHFHLTENVVIPAVWEAPVGDGYFPLVIMSHGLVAHRGISSSICNDLASHGFIVAAIEHR